MAFVSTARPRVLPLPSMQSVSVTCMSKGEKEESGAILDDQDASKKDPLYLGVETWGTSALFIIRRRGLHS